MQEDRLRPPHHPPCRVVKSSLKALQSCTASELNIVLKDTSAGFISVCCTWCLLKDSLPLHCAATAFSSICTDSWAGKHSSELRYSILMSFSGVGILESVHSVSVCTCRKTLFMKRQIEKKFLHVLCCWS